VALGVGFRIVYSKDLGLGLGLRDDEEVYKCRVHGRDRRKDTEHIHTYTKLVDHRSEEAVGGLIRT
jgi:hypothetical protein